jgi:hypothetical protein
MAKKSDDRAGEVMDGLDTLIQAGRVDEVEQLLSTLVDSASTTDLSDEEREMHSYARGVRDGIALARGLPEASAG